ncbi:MAG: hypothetical protein ABF651_04780 [Sporolactobacillus sp.]
MHLIRHNCFVALIESVLFSSGILLAVFVASTLLDKGFSNYTDLWGMSFFYFLVVRSFILAIGKITEHSSTPRHANDEDIS